MVVVVGGWLGCYGGGEGFGGGGDLIFLFLFLLVFVVVVVFVVGLEEEGGFAFVGFD